MKDKVVSPTLLAVLSVEVLARAVCGNKVIDDTTLKPTYTIWNKKITSLKILGDCYEVSGLKLNDKNKERNQKPFGLE